MITPPGGLDIARQGVKRSAFAIGFELMNRARSDELLDDRRDPPDRERQAVRELFETMRRDEQAGKQ